MALEKEPVFYSLKLKSHRIKGSHYSNYLKNEESMVGPIEIEGAYEDHHTPVKTLFLEDEGHDLQRLEARHLQSEYRFYHPIRGNSNGFSFQDEKNPVISSAFQRSINFSKGEASVSPFRHEEISEEITNSFWNYLQRRNRIDPSRKETAYNRDFELLNSSPIHASLKANNLKYVKESPYKRNKLSSAASGKIMKYTPSSKSNRNGTSQLSNTRTSINMYTNQNGCEENAVNLCRLQDSTKNNRRQTRLRSKHSTDSSSG